jgi:AraC-like DNA-binding protein
MTIDFEERPSDSPYIESVTRGRTLSAGAPIRPAETHWHLVFTRVQDQMLPFVVGPWSTAGVVEYGPDAEILWIKFSLGTFMPHLPTRDLLNSETLLPEGTRQSFWLKSTTWRLPDFDNVETFVDWLVRAEVLVRDPVVEAALQDHVPEMAPRTVRHRFLRATGQTLGHIWQMRRAERAMALLQQGVSILDTVYEAGYFDQPHLTRSLKQFIGYTPAQIVRMSQAACHSVQDNAIELDDNTYVLKEVR